MVISPALRLNGGGGGGGVKWIRRMQETAALVGGILALIQPNLFNNGVQALKKLYESGHIVHGSTEELRSILEMWTSPFTALSVISNRITPPHRDCKSGRTWMDILVALGNYEEGYAQFPSLGIQVDYQPGTVLGVTSRVVPHAAECFGDRACIAFYMRENVWNKLAMGETTWYNIQDLLDQGRQEEENNVYI
jgi:hypothetical protein